MLKFLLLAACGSLAFGQQYTISTVAGGAPPSTPATATNVSIGQPERVTYDKAGNVYFSSSDNCVFKLSTSGVLSLVAGNGRPGFSGDGGPAVNAQLNTPQGVAFDPSGNLYIADSLNNRVRMVNPQGIISTFAGTGATSPDSVPGSFNDGGPPAQALLKAPQGVATDSAGNVYIADTGDNLIRVVTLATGIITSVAGDGYPGYLGEDGPSIHAELHTPSDVTIDSSSNIWIADTANEYIREVVASTGLIHHLVGYNGTPNYAPGTEGYSGDGASAQLATLYWPTGLVFDSSGNLYIVEQGDSRVREVNEQTGTVTFPGTQLKVESGWIETVVGTDIIGFDSSVTIANQTPLNYPTGMTVDASGNMYIADTLNLRVRKVNNNAISTVAGNGLLSYGGDGGAGTSAQLNAPQGVAVDPLGNIYIADTNNNSIRKISSGVITTVAGSGITGAAAAGNGSNQFAGPEGMASDSGGNIYIADSENARIVKLSASGGLSVVAGNGTTGYGGDGSAATSAMLSAPSSVAVDSSGNLYIADFNNNRIRKVSLAGTISTIAGNGAGGYTGDGGQATSAQINLPRGVAVDGAGNIYIADTGNNAIREVTPAGMISTIAQIVSPVSIAVDSLGDLYVTDGSSLVYKVYPFSSSIVAIIGGNATAGYAGDGGLGSSAELNGPTGIALDAKGNIYVADTFNNSVRELQFAGSTAAVTALVSAGSGLPGVVAPGELVVLYGAALGPASLSVASPVNGAYLTNLGGTQVFFNGVAAPIYYTSATQVAAVVPFELSGSQVTILVQYNGQTSSAFTASVASVSPALFTLNGEGTGQAAAINAADGSVNGASHPASAGNYVSLYLTGAGQTSPASQDGSVAGYNGAPLPKPVASATVTIGGKTASTNYIGAAPGAIAGLIQINAQVPSGLTAGNVPVVVDIAGVSSQPGVTIAVTGN